MKRLMLVLLMFFSLSALADHHRGQALANLSNATADLKLADIAYQKYYDTTIFTDQEQLNADSTLRYIDAALSTIRQAELILGCSAGDLNEARRLVNQPSGAGPLSALRRTSHILLLANETISVAHPQALADYADFTLSLMRAWNQLDQTDWHIVDAILEEQFGQP